MVSQSTYPALDVCPSTAQARAHPEEESSGRKFVPSRARDAAVRLQQLKLIEQLSRCLNSNIESQRVLRLALRMAMAGMPECVGAQVSLLTGPTTKVTVIHTIGWKARLLKGNEVDLADFGRLQPFCAAGNKPDDAAANSHGPREWLPLLKPGMHLLAFPIVSEGRLSGVLSVACTGHPAAGDEDFLFLKVVADLIATSIANEWVWSEVAARTRESAVLKEVDPVALRGLSFSGMMRVIARAARELTRSERISISALNVDGQSGIPLVILGQAARVLRKDQTPMGRGLPRWVVEHGEPIFSNNLLSDPRVDPQWMLKFSLRSGACVPLLVKGRVIGCLAVYNRRQQEPYSQRDIGVLTHFALHAAAAIENASLSDRYRRTPLAGTLIWQMLSERRRGIGHLAVATERTQIARDLHDGLAQDISNLNFRLQLVEQMVNDGVTHNAIEVRRELAVMREAVSNMYSEVRERISVLRTPVNWSEDFGRELVKCVEGCAEMNGIQVDVDVPARPVKLPLLIGLRLLQIVDEALANIRQHAVASQVQVVLRTTNRQLELSVTDDGRGFKTEINRTCVSHFGIRSMREGAKEIGAQFGISCRPDRGTRIVIVLPKP